MKRLALVTGHFAPSNLVGGHRARLWSRLPAGVRLGADRRHRRSRRATRSGPDPDLERLVAPGLRVIHAPTLPTRPVRLVGRNRRARPVGCYRVLADLAARREIDFVLVTIPSNFLAPVGRLVHRRYGVPFGIDYQDPWVNRWHGVDVPLEPLPGARTIWRRSSSRGRCAARA
jgi:hypothetical protein